MGWIRWFQELDQDAASSVGTKNAALGELVRHLGPLGVRVPDGFALVVEAYREHVRSNGLEAPLRELLSGLDEADLQEIARRSARARQLVLEAEVPAEVAQALREAYAFLSRHCDPVAPGERAWVAVRSSSPTVDAGLAGRRDSFLYVQGEEQLLDRVRRCWASQFHPSAIALRISQGLEPWEAALSVGIQRVVHADQGCSGTASTLDPASGDREVVQVTSSWGLSPSVVRDHGGPDTYYLHKEGLRRRRGRSPIVLRKAGHKQLQVQWDELSLELVQVTPSEDDRARLTLEDGEVMTLARWALAAEDHWTRLEGRETAVELDWARDGQTGQLYAIQVRPLTPPRTRVQARRVVDKATPAVPVDLRARRLDALFSRGPFDDGAEEERDPLKVACDALIEAARRAPRPATGAAPTDADGFTTLVVEPGLDTIGASADALLQVVGEAQRARVSA